jgi:hypothetical protein
MCIILLEECGYSHPVRGVRVEEEEEIRSSVSPLRNSDGTVKGFWRAPDESESSGPCG